MKNILFAITIGFTAVSLSACSQAPDKTDIGMYCEPNNGEVQIATIVDESTSGTGSNAEPEGPQYQQPSMDVLRGKAQLYPAKYPLKRYPNSRVAMVDVRPNRGAGLKNMVMLYTSDEMDRVSKFYQKRLIAENWKLVSEYANESYESSRWIKGEHECEIRISPDLTTSDKKYIQLLCGLRPATIAQGS